MSDKEVKQKGSRTKRLFKRLINIGYWLDIERLKEISRYVVATFKKFFIPSRQEAKESFSEAMKRFNLSEQDIITRQTSLFRLFCLMLVLAAGIFIYTLYLFWQQAWHAAGFSLIVLGLALVLAFRYHFWYFQIKQRKLGCSLQEWFRIGLLGEKS